MTDEKCVCVCVRESEMVRERTYPVDERPREKELLETNGERERERERFKKYIIWKYRELRCESGVPVHAKRNTGHLVSPTAVVATTPQSTRIPDTSSPPTPPPPTTTAAARRVRRRPRQQQSRTNEIQSTGPAAVSLLGCPRDNYLSVLKPPRPPPPLHPVVHQYSRRRFAYRPKPFFYVPRTR